MKLFTYTNTILINSVNCKCSCGLGGYYFIHLNSCLGIELNNFMIKYNRKEKKRKGSAYYEKIKEILL